MNEEYVLFCMSSKLSQEQMFQILLIVFIVLAFINVPLCRKMINSSNSSSECGSVKIFAEFLCFLYYLLHIVHYHRSLTKLWNVG
jgi:hypothetical protein